MDGKGIGKHVGNANGQDMGLNIKGVVILQIDEYQKLAARTMNHHLTKEETLRHSLFEMCGELGEIHSIYQKVYQGHQIKVEDLKLEVGDLLWGIAEFCTVNGWSLEEICQMNVDKLKKRYPEGFAEERSLDRDE